MFKDGEVSARIDWRFVSSDPVGKCSKWFWSTVSLSLSDIDDLTAFKAIILHYHFFSVNHLVEVKTISASMQPAL